MVSVGLVPLEVNTATQCHSSNTIPLFEGYTYIHMHFKVPLGISLFVCQFVCLIIVLLHLYILFFVSIEDDGIGWFGVLGGQFVSVVFAYYDTATAECQCSYLVERDL